MLDKYVSAKPLVQAVHLFMLQINASVWFGLVLAWSPNIWWEMSQDLEKKKNSSVTSNSFLAASNTAGNVPQVSLSISTVIALINAKKHTRTMAAHKLAWLDWLIIMHLIEKHWNIYFISFCGISRWPSSGPLSFMQSFVKGLSNFYVISLHTTYLLFTTAQDGGTAIRECGG